MIQRQVMICKTIKETTMKKNNFSAPIDKDNAYFAYLNTFEFSLKSLTTLNNLVSFNNLVKRPSLSILTIELKSPSLIPEVVLSLEILEAYLAASELAPIKAENGRIASVSIKNHPFRYSHEISLRSS
jgi:hypothetical protein